MAIHCVFFNLQMIRGLTILGYYLMITAPRYENTKLHKQDEKALVSKWFALQVASKAFSLSQIIATWMPSSDGKIKKNEYKETLGIAAHNLTYNDETQVNCMQDTRKRSAVLVNCKYRFKERFALNEKKKRPN